MSPCCSSSGVDLHSYQPTADDIVKIADCDLFLYVGGESDGWVDDALAGSGEQGQEGHRPAGGAQGYRQDRGGHAGHAGREGDHGYSHFDDSDVQEHHLSDWDGDWQSVYPFLTNGTLDEVMEHKAEQQAQDRRGIPRLYETGHKIDVSQITIDSANNTMCFVKNGIAAKGVYQYKGHQIYDYESGSRGVRYFFQKTGGDADAPKFVQFSDHGIAPGKAEHFHIFAGNDSF